MALGCHAEDASTLAHAEARVPPAPALA